MQPFSLYYPIKPYRLNQEWGVYRPDVYGQFGFTRHNGIDLALVNGQEIRAPIDLRPVWVGYQPNGAGYFITLQTPEQYVFLDGTIAYAELTFMHLLKLPEVNMEKVYKTGVVIALGGNTGFSTGPHTHFRLRRLKLVQSHYVVIDTNEAQNSIDPVPYFNGQYAADVAPPFKHFFSQDLEYGDVSEEVQYLQMALKLQGMFRATEITPFYGKITLQAVKDFQRKYKIVTWGTPALTGYGRVGRLTRQKLNVLYA
jgi:hypothetical protein